MTLNKLRLRANEKGFTLIELMIVIAIIGILAAIAIPNFISYRNKTFCSAAESDANTISGAIANYFAVPSRINLPTMDNLTLTGKLSGNPSNTATIGGTPNGVISIVVTDVSGRCPADYQGANPGWTGNVYTKNME